jgi:uncharacterized membrane protein
MFSLTIYCSTVLTRDVTDLIYPRNITTIADVYLGTLLLVRYVSLHCYETEIQRRCEVQYVPQCYNKMYWQSH